MTEDGVARALFTLITTHGDTAKVVDEIARQPKQNDKAIYYINKIVGLSKEIERLQEECEKHTGVQFCEIGAKHSFLGGPMRVHLFESIDKLGLPVEIQKNSDGTACRRVVNINGYQIFEVINESD